MEIIVLVKRTIFFRLFSVLCMGTYVSLIVLSLIFPEIYFFQFWFSGLLVMVGTVSFVRYFCYKIDSSLFLGTVCLLSGISGILNFFFLFNTSFVASLCFFSFAFASLAIFIKFRHFFHLKTFVFESICGILLLLLSYQLLSLIPFVILFSVAGLAIVVLIISSIKRNTRKV